MQAVQVRQAGGGRQQVQQPAVQYDVVRTARQGGAVPLRVRQVTAGGEWGEGRRIEMRLRQGVAAGVNGRGEGRRMGGGGEEHVVWLFTVCASEHSDPLWVRAGTGQAAGVRY